MPFLPGSRIGVYEVIGPLGAGGMGEVYRARDTRLDRDVALKILPQSFAGDPDRLMRFEREAKTLASINHPNIAAIYGIEERALVMELVEGEDLSARIARGPIPIDEALPMAKQIADALEAAHEQGIIHRDLKPANIKVRGDGTVKVLDFGLAKALDASGRSAAPGGPGRDTLLNPPTITSPAMTLQGVILGTAAYMAPEQAKGKAVDKRADIWAFGCVLFEMLTGRRAFEGEDITDTLAALITRDPDWSLLPQATPPQVALLLRRCLEKNTQRRLPHIGVARLDLENAPVPMTVTSAPTPAKTRARAWMLAALAVTLIAGVAAGMWFARRAPSAAAVNTYRASILIPAEESLLVVAPTSRFAISPDGTQLAYVGSNGRTQQLWLRSLDDFSARAIATFASGVAESIFWSPDSRYIAFFSGAQLMKADIRGGTAVAITESPSFRLQPQPGTWNRQDVIIVGGGPHLSRVPARGGTLAPLTSLDPATGEDWHGFPYFLPDGDHFVYTAYKGLAPLAVYLSSLDTPAQRSKLMDGGSNAQYAAGALLFMRGNTLVSQTFDPSTLVLSGDPAPIAENVLPNIAVRFGGAFSVSQTGALVHQTTGRESGISSAGDRLVWRTRDGTEQRLTDAAASYRHIAIAPNSRRALVSQMNTNGRSDLWVIDLQRAMPTRLTFGNQENGGVWLSNDEVVFNSSAKTGNLNLYRKQLAGTAAESMVFTDDRPKTPLSVSTNGRLLLFERTSTETAQDIWVVPLDGSDAPKPFLNAPYQERWAQFSPDGRWVAYMSDESGVREIYVRSFPGGDRHVRISRDGGDYPRWSRNGDELFFYGDGKMMAAAFRPQAADPAVVSVTPLFDCRPPDGFTRFFYDVAPDGRFLMMTPSGTRTTTPLTLTINWPGLIRPRDH